MALFAICNKNLFSFVSCSCLDLTIYTDLFTLISYDLPNNRLCGLRDICKLDNILSWKDFM